MNRFSLKIRRKTADVLPTVVTPAAVTSAVPGEYLELVLLTSTPPVLNPPAATTPQWYIGDVPIDGATEPSYLPVHLDVGTSPRCGWLWTGFRNSHTFFTDAVGPIEGIVQEPTTLVTSLPQGAFEFFFDRPAPGGMLAGEQLFVISDRYFEIPTITPECVLITSGSYIPNGGSTPITSDIPANGAEINPWKAAEDAKQGIDGLIGITAAGSGPSLSSAMEYDAALNVDPSAPGNGPIVVNIGDEFTIWKSRRRLGKTTPDTNWEMIEDYCVLHVIPPSKAPPLGAFGPSASNPDKTCYLSVAARNKNALPGFAPAEGMPTLTQCLDGDYFRGLQPFFGQSAEQRRRWMCGRANAAGTVGNGYSGEFGPVWCDFVAALLAEGPDVDDAALNMALAFGITMIGNYDAFGDCVMPASGGAGQWDGHKQFAQLLGHVFAAVPGLMTKCLAIRGNCTQQTFWVPESFVGMPTSSPGNHGVFFDTFGEEHVGRPYWAHHCETHPPTPALHFNSHVDADYEFVAGRGSFPEMINILMLREGPGGRDGGEVLAGIDVAGTLDFWATEGSAAIAYTDRYRSFARADIYKSSPSAARHIAYYDARRVAGSRMPLWSGAPDAGTPYNSAGSGNKGSSIVAAVSGGFSWNLANLGQATDTNILEQQIEYGLLQTIRSGTYQSTAFIIKTAISWYPVDSPLVANSQLGLAVGSFAVHAVRYRRRTEDGFSAWTVNYVREAGARDRLTVTPGGTAAGTPTNRNAPSLFIRKYPRAQDPSFVAAPAIMVLEETTLLYAGIGYWLNITSAPVIQWLRNGADIPGENSTVYSLRSTDLLTDIAFRVTVGVVSVTSPAVAIPAAPDKPAGLIFESTMDASLDLYYPLMKASFVANSVNCSSVVLDPDYLKTVTVGDDEVEITRSVLRGNKLGQRPILQGDIAADEGMLIGHAYNVTANIPIGVNKAVSSGANVIIVFSSAKAGGTVYHTHTWVPADGQPSEVPIEFQIASAVSAACWCSIKVDTGTGSSGGGDPQVSYFKIEEDFG